MKRGFTLIELLIVMGIMGMLGVMAIGSYRALSRGMEDRSAIAAAQSFLETAVQRSDVDRSVVHVFCYDRLDQKASSDGTRDRRGHGYALAIRKAGRVSGIGSGKRSTLVMDEFSDLDQLYASSDEENYASSSTSGKMGGRKYLMDGSGKYFDIEASVEAYNSSERFIVSGQNEADASSGGGKTIRICAFKLTGGTTPHVGDAYGMEFQNIELPNGYYFSSSPPTSVGATRSPVKHLTINPGASGVTLDIYRQRPGSSSADSIGTAQGRR